MRLTFSTYGKGEMGPGIEKIFIVSDLDEAALLKDELEKNLNILTEVLQSADNILCQKDINLSTLNDQFGLSLTVGFGLAVSDQTDLINLVPEETHEEKQFLFKKMAMIRFFILFLVAMCLGGSVFGIEIHQKEKRLQFLEQKLNGMKGEVKSAKKKLRLVRFFQEKLRSKTFISEIMSELTDITPSEVSFRTLILDDKGRFTIQGFAEDSVSVNRFQERLVRSDIFREVNRQFSTKRFIFNMDVVDFKFDTKLAQRVSAE